jgi:signal transduction histidine kinase
MDTRRFFCRIIPAVVVSVFILGAAAVFALKYSRAGAVPLFFDTDAANNRLVFFLNFYIPLAVCLAGLFGCLCGAGFLFRGICLVLSFTAAIIAGYVLDDLFTINICVYGAYVLTAAAAFPPPKNYLISGTAVPLFMIFLARPSFMGLARFGERFARYPAGQVIPLALYLALLAAAMCAIRLLAEKHADSEAQAAHLNQVGTKMLLFNHRLQEYAKNYGDEAVKKDRLRFTSELHDSSGYVFTNIIAITDAAISFPSMETQKMHDTFQLIQNQAREGLRKTREALYMIRGIQDPGSGSVETIREMKSIFEEVTGIKVEVEAGNMKLDYGPEINRSLVRIIQEAFTNSVRHGKATRIGIRFWELPGELEMVLRDNGIGAQNIVKGIGLAGMEERLALLGGRLEVWPPEDGGFALKVVIPVGEPAGFPQGSRGERDG